MGDCNEECADIYEDLPHFRYDETLDRLNATIAKLEAENNELHSKLAEMKTEKSILDKNCSILTTNITSLLKTAKLEVQRKERTINDLRKQLNELSRPSTGLGVKRQFENTNYEHRNTGIVSDSKRDSKICEPDKKKTRFNESDGLKNESVSRIDEPTNENLNSLKLPPKTTHASQKENLPLALSKKFNTSDEANTSPRIAAPSLPSIDCPTLFSARMYQRIYNKHVSQTVTLPSVPLIPTSGAELQSRIPEDKSNEPQKRAIESGKIVLKTPESTGKLISCSSSRTSVTCSSSDTSATKNSHLTGIKYNSWAQKLESSTHSVSGPIKIISKSVPSKDQPPSESSKTKIDVGIDISVTQPSKVLVSQAVQSRKSRESTPDIKKRSHPSEESCKLANSNDPVLKLPSSLKGKSGSRNMFVPISNSWGCLKSTSVVSVEESSSNKHQQMANSELCSVTSELLVKIDDDKFDERRKLMLDVFGSPVKWADDCSSDSVKVEGTAAVNRKKVFYSIFGSPYKNGDSCSSEPCNFSLPPGAYEDSCWTNLPPDKASPRPAMPPTSLVDSSSNPVIREKTSLSTSGSNELVNGKKEVYLPPPVLPVVKKVPSVFSPLKDSKNATSLPSATLDDRSATGICFPFKSTTTYEDSVLGQFDDTAQFVSALAKVDTKISPLSTPLKEPDLTSESKTIDSTPLTNPTSFKEVFQSKILHDAPAVSSSETLTVDKNKSPIPFSNEVTNTGPEPSCSISMKSPQTPEKSPQHKIDVSNINGTVRQSITSNEVVDPPSVLSSKFIHRSNFSSSSVFSVSSDSNLDKPINVLQPRKIPRTVANKRSSMATNGCGNDVKLNPRIAIPDAFITEQEERVRQWEKNHSYESTLKSGFTPKIPSPTKHHLKIQSSSSDVKTFSPPKSQSKMSSPIKNRKKTTSPSREECSSPIVPKGPLKTEVINRLQPKRVPRHVVTVKRNGEALLKNVAALAKPTGVNTTVPNPLEVKYPLSPNDPSCATDTTIKALDMIRSVIAKTESVNTTRTEKKDTVDGLEEKLEPVKIETPTANLNPSKSNGLVTVKCEQQSLKYVEGVSLVKSNNSRNSIVSKVSASSTSQSPAIAPIVRRVGDFKRSSSLKKSVGKTEGNAVIPFNKTLSTSEHLQDLRPIAKNNLPSNRMVIRRKSAPNLCNSSQSNESRVISKTPIKSSQTPIASSTKEKEDDAQFRRAQIADTIVPNKWRIYPIELEDFQNRYECITSSFSSNDPRAQPRSFKSRNLPILKCRDDFKESNSHESKVADHLIEAEVANSSMLRCPNVFSPNTSAISRDCVRGVARSQADLTRTFVTSTPQMKAGRGLPTKEHHIKNESRNVFQGETNLPQQSLHNSNEISLGTQRKTGRPAERIRSSSRIANKESKRSAVTQAVLSPPQESYKEPKITSGSRKSPRCTESSAAGKSTEASSDKEKVSIDSTFTDPKPVILSESNYTSSPALEKKVSSFSQSASTTVQPVLIKRKRRNPNFSSITNVHSTKQVTIQRKGKAIFTVSSCSPDVIVDGKEHK